MPAKKKAKAPSKLPALPAFAFTALGEVPVLRAEEVARKENGVETMGVADWANRTITVRTELALESAWHTYFHEQAHFLFWDADIEMPPELEERICNCYATFRVQEMVTRR